MTVILSAGAKHRSRRIASSETHDAILRLRAFGAALRMTLADDGGGTLAEYGMVAAGIAAPFIVVALAIIATASGTLGSTTGGMQSIGVNPP